MSTGIGLPRQLQACEVAHSIHKYLQEKEKAYIECAHV